MYHTPIFAEQSRRVENEAKKTDGMKLINGETGEHTGLFAAGGCFSQNGNL